MTRPTDLTGESGQQRGPLGCLPLGHWHGVEVDAHWSVFVTLGLFVTVLATATLPDAHPGDTRSAYWLVAAGTAVAFFLSLLAHELAHALVARSHGMEVKRITLWMLGESPSLQLWRVDGYPPWWSRRTRTPPRSSPGSAHVVESPWSKRRITRSGSSRRWS